MKNKLKQGQTPNSTLSKGALAYWPILNYEIYGLDAIMSPKLNHLT